MATHFRREDVLIFCCLPMAHRRLLKHPSLSTRSASRFLGNLYRHFTGVKYNQVVLCKLRALSCRVLSVATTLLLNCEAAIGSECLAIHSHIVCPSLTGHHTVSVQLVQCDFNLATK